MIPEARSGVASIERPSTCPSNWMIFIEFPIASALFVVASLNLAYRPMWLILTASAVLFLSFRSYLYWRYRISVPALVLGLAFGAVGIDTAGNHFYWYQGHGWAIPYDRIAHATVPALLFPAIAWLLREWLAQIRVTLPLSVLVFFSANLNFAMAAFYEITEVWDDLYFGGDRIKDILDTPRDLQFDLLASVIGALVTYAVMKPLELKRDPRASASHAFASPAQIR